MNAEATNRCEQQNVKTPADEQPSDTPADATRVALFLRGIQSTDVADAVRWIRQTDDEPEEPDSIKL